MATIMTTKKASSIIMITGSAVRKHTIMSMVKAVTMTTIMTTKKASSIIMITGNAVRKHTIMSMVRAVTMATIIMGMKDAAAMAMAITITPMRYLQAGAEKRPTNILMRSLIIW